MEIDELQREIENLENNFVELIHNDQFEQFWNYLALFLCKYFRLEVRGLKNLPQDQPFILIANHSGFIGLDALILSHIVHQQIDKAPHLLAHWGYFELSKFIRKIAYSFGLRQAKSKHALQELLTENPLIIFPEGEAGNFKSSFKKYHLQKFHTGYLRLACKANVPIVPCHIIGAEEANLNWGSLDLSMIKRGLRIPLPINLFPMPAKWKIKIGKPLHIDLRSLRDNVAKTNEVNEEIRAEMQQTIKNLLRKRKSVF